DKEAISGEKEEEKSKSLYLKFDVENKQLYSSVIDILKCYVGGENDVVVVSENNGHAFKVKNRKVNINNSLINELCGIIKSENIVVR
ncbi:MAG: hypothetical protein RR400_03255, partial [Clostridia bacterium]